MSHVALGPRPQYILSPSVKIQVAQCGYKHYLYTEIPRICFDSRPQAPRATALIPRPTSPKITPIVVPYLIPFEEFRLALATKALVDRPSSLVGVNLNI